MFPVLHIRCAFSRQDRRLRRFLDGAVVSGQPNNPVRSGGGPAGSAEVANQEAALGIALLFHLVLWGGLTAV